MGIQIFENVQFGQLRGMNIDGKAWLMGTDVARRLGYINPQKAIRDHVDYEDKTVNDSFSVNGTTPVLISESGVYSLIFSSKMPQAREFKHWVTSEVLPAIRQTGSYVAQPSPEDFNMALQQTLLQTQQLIKAMDAKYHHAIDAIADLRPKAEYCEQVLEVPNCLTTSQVAKDLGRSAIALNQLLHELKVQYKQGEVWMLYAEWQNLGLTDYRSHLIEEHSMVKQRMVWTQKGRAWIINMIEKGMTPREALKAMAPLCQAPHCSPKEGGKIGLGVEQMVLVFE